MAGYSESHKTGRTTTQNADAVMGVIQQNAESTDSSLTRVDADLQFGVPILVRATIKEAAADGAHEAPIFAKNCPEKYHIADAWYIMRSHRTSAGTITHTIKLEHGDGAASESFNDITDAADCDAAAEGVVDQPYRWGTVSDAYDTISAGESLKATCTIGGTSNDGTTLVDVYVLLMPVRA